MERSGIYFQVRKKVKFSVSYTGGTLPVYDAEKVTTGKTKKMIFQSVESSNSELQLKPYDELSSVCTLPRRHSHLINFLHTQASDNNSKKISVDKVEAVNVESPELLKKWSSVPISVCNLSEKQTHSTLDKEKIVIDHNKKMNAHASKAVKKEKQDSFYMSAAEQSLTCKTSSSDVISVVCREKVICDEITQKGSDHRRKTVKRENFE